MGDKMKDVDKKDAEEELKKENLHVCGRTGLLICYQSPSCSIGMLVERKKVWGHLVKTHNMKHDMYLKCLKNAKSLVPSVVDEELREKYKEGGAQHGELPLVQGVPVYQGKKCFQCDKIYKNDETLRTHLGRKHIGHGKNAADISILPVRACQSLSVRGGFFFVTEPTSAGERKERAASWLEKYDPGAVQEVGEGGIPDSRLTPFGSSANVPKRLEVSGLNLEQAGRIMNLYSALYDEVLRNKMECVGQAMVYLLQQAKKGVDRIGETTNLLWVIQTPGMKGQDRCFQFLKGGQEATLSRYAKHACLIVRIACVVVSRRKDLPGVLMSEEVEKAVRKLMEKEGETDKEGFAEVVFNLLWVVFTEPSTKDGVQGGQSFGSAVVACCCVENDECGVSLYARGVSVGSKMSGILYAASCVFALSIVKYSGGLEYEEARERVKELTDKESLSSVHFFTDMRSTAAGLREEESNLNPFETCRMHVNCGIYAGVEMSAEKLGAAVRAMHEKVEMKMFQMLMNGAKLPKGFWERVYSMVEDYENKTVGFWAMSDIRNKKLVDDSLKWALEAADVDGLEKYGWAGWKRCAEDVLLELLTAVHISGGGPARGTEIAALTVRNTRGCRRTVFFPRGEVMTLPCYSKTRNMKRGKLIILSRHADRETSRLLRAFFLLVYPVLVIESGRRVAKPSEPAKGGAPANVRDLLTMDIWKPEKIAEKIGGKLREYKIPLTFSNYRHLQRGIVKWKVKSAHLRAVIDAEDAALADVESMEKEGQDGNDARIVQAGHSRKTAEVVYAQSVRGGKDAKLSTEQNIDRFRLASEEWHSDLGLLVEEKLVDSKGCGGKGQRPAKSESKKLEKVQGLADGKVESNAAVESLLGSNQRIADLIANMSESELIMRLEGDQSRDAQDDSLRRLSVEAANKVVSNAEEDKGDEEGDVGMSTIPVVDVPLEGSCGKSNGLGCVGGSMNRTHASDTAAVVKPSGSVPSPDTLQSKSNNKRIAVHSFFSKKKNRKSESYSESEGATQSSSLANTRSGNGVSFGPMKMRDTAGSGAEQSVRRSLTGVLQAEFPPNNRGVSKIVGGPFDELQALQNVTHKKAKFKSHAQKRAMLAVASRKHDVAVILRTGEGKTAVVMAPVKQEEGVTVWIVPLRALRWEMERRFKDASIQVRTVEDVDVVSDAKSCGIVLVVSPEDIKDDKFKKAMYGLKENGGLNRFVVDEAHLAVTAASYRGCMSLLRGATEFGGLCPVVMLTATAPPSLLDKMATACGSHNKGLEKVIGDPCRPNLSLNVVDLVDDSEETLIKGAVDTVCSHQKGMEVEGNVDDTGRVLVVCLTINDTVRIHEALGMELGEKEVLLHHSDLRMRERGEVMQQWKSPINGAWRVIVATEGFSTGTDAPDVRLVLFAGAARNLVDFWQGAGRGGRDGKPAVVTVLFHRAHVSRANAGKSEVTSWSEDVGDFIAWAEGKKSCRRSRVEMWLTGKGSAPKCEERLKGGDNVALCDVCVEEKERRESLDEAWGDFNDMMSGTSVPTEIEMVTSVPSAAEAYEAEQHNRVLARTSVDEIAYLRRAASNLRSLCLDHVLTLYNRGSVKYPAEQVKRWLKCPKCQNLDKFCPYGNRCFRCQEPGCSTKKCGTFFSIRRNAGTGKSTGNGRCQQCRLVVVNGMSPHEGNEFGKREFCILKHCLHLLMRAWNREDIRKHMLASTGGVEWGKDQTPKNRKQYGEWLTFDSAGKPAGICTALHWIFDNMPFDLGTMDLN